MLESCVKVENGLPTLYIDERPATEMAYTTYFTERSRHADFASAGYRIFFVNASFTTLSINTDTDFTPFRVGVFENPDYDDYSEFESAVKDILNDCPDAIIFPRIYISMPKWWIDMWGGWYADPCLMAEIAEMKKIYDTGLTSSEDMLSAEVVFFADEESYANVFSGSPQISGIFGSRIAIGKSGVPYDTCAVGDAKELLKKYKAAIFPFPIPSESGARNEAVRGDGNTLYSRNR